MTGGVDCFTPFAMTMCVERHCDRVIIKGYRGNDLPLPPPKGDKKGKWSSSIQTDYAPTAPEALDKKGKWSSSIPLWRGCRGRLFLMNN